MESFVTRAAAASGGACVCNTNLLTNGAGTSGNLASWTKSPLTAPITDGATPNAGSGPAPTHPVFNGAIPASRPTSYSMFQDYSFAVPAHAACAARIGLGLTAVIGGVSFGTNTANIAVQAQFFNAANASLGLISDVNNSNTWKAVTGSAVVPATTSYIRFSIVWTWGNGNPANTMQAADLSLSFTGC